MELKKSDDDSDVMRLFASGEITQRDLSADDEPIADLIGQDVYRQKVLIDLGQTNYIDSSGIGWLLRCHSRFAKQGGMMVLHSTPPVVQNVLNVLRLDVVFNLADDDAAACVLLKGESS